MRARALLAPLALLACATPREACIAQATRDLRVLDRLIAQTEANLARGYAVERVTEQEYRFVPCPGERRVIVRPDGTREVVRDAPGYCWEWVPVQVDRPRAIDAAAERRILASTRADRARKAREAEAAIAACIATHPAG